MVVTEVVIGSCLKDSVQSVRIKREGRFTEGVTTVVAIKVVISGRYTKIAIMKVVFEVVTLGVKVTDVDVTKVVLIKSLY